MDLADHIIDGAENRFLTIIMDGNPLNCDCNILAFKTFNLKGVNFEYKNLTCQQPQWLVNVDFHSCKLKLKLYALQRHNSQSQITRNLFC
jgi:hypothetical protein